MTRPLVALSVLASTLFAQGPTTTNAVSSAVGPGTGGMPVSAVAAAVKVGIPIGPEVVTPTATGISINGLGGYNFCSASTPLRYLDPCKIAPTSLATKPTVKVPMSGYKFVRGGTGSLVPTPVSGANRLLEIHTPANNKTQPKLVIATSAAQ